MPGKHAPASPWSFYRSLARAGAGVAGVILLVVVLAVVAFGGRGEKKAPGAIGTSSPTASLTATPSESPSPTPSPSLRTLADTKVKVLNGNGRPGLARQTGLKIKAAGYDLVDTGNTALPAGVSTIYYQPLFEQEALALQRAFPAFTQVKPAGDAPSDVKVDTMIVCVLGRDWPKE